MNGQCEEHKYYALDIIITVTCLYKLFRIDPCQDWRLPLTLHQRSRKLIINFYFTFTRDEQSENYRLCSSNDKYHVPQGVPYHSSKGNETI